MKRTQVAPFVLFAREVPRYTLDVWDAVRRSDPDYDTLEKWISVTTGRDGVRRAIFERTVAGGSR